MSETLHLREAGAYVVPMSSSFHRAVVTTQRRPGERDQAEARDVARALDLPFVPRANLSLQRLALEASIVLIVAAGDRALWFPGLPQPWRFHGGLGVLRIRRLLRGLGDPLLDACDIREGDTILDATGGACADALVLAHAVGTGGRVEVIESSELLHTVVSHGVETIRFGEEAVDSALDRMRVHRADHGSHLASMEDGAVDVVYFDPMFREPAKAPPGFGVIRMLANHSPLTEEVLQEALRVARRRVVVQDHREGSELERLGIPVSPTGGRYSSIRFGVLEKRREGTASSPRRC